MRHELSGRIVERWEDGEDEVVELLVGAAAHLLRAPRGAFALDVGDLVTVESDGAGRLTAARKTGGVAFGRWDPAGDPTRWRARRRLAPPGEPTRMELLWQRQEILRALRDDLYREGFLEVTAPLLLRATCPDVALDSVAAEGGYLSPSTEYQLKRMVVGGFDKVFTLTQNFRAGDLGERHNPEFTMLEWARGSAPLEAIEADAERLVRAAHARLAPEASDVTWGGQRVTIAGPPWPRWTVREALGRCLGLDVAEDFSLDSLKSEVGRAALAVPPDFLADRHLLLSFLLDAMQPQLGRGAPLFLRDWPAFMTSSAAERADRPGIAERSELFVAGLELADGFPSLRDPLAQRAAFERESERRRALGRRPVALDERYVEALRLGIPPGAGMALGVDRLAMLLTGRSQIRDVLAFSWEER